MERTSQSQEKGLFTFYKQQEKLSSSEQTSNYEEQKTRNKKQQPKRKIKKKQKRPSSLIKKSIEKEAESQGQNQNSELKQETIKKGFKKAKGSKKSKKKIISELKLQSKTTQVKMHSKNEIIPSKTVNSPQKSQSMSKQEAISLEKPSTLPLRLTKKNVISDTNIALKPFQKVNFSEDDELLSKQIFEKSTVYDTKNQEIQKFICEKNLMQNSLGNNISQKFLSNVVRKNAQTSLENYHKTIGSQNQNKSSISENPQTVGEQSRAICINQSSSDGHILSYHDIFRNQHISKCFSPQKIQKYQSKQLNSNNSQRKGCPKVALKTKLIRMKTEALNPIHSFIYENGGKFQQLKKYTEDSVFTEPLLKDNGVKQMIIKQKMCQFMSIHRSSFTVHQIPKKESIQIFESYEALQNQKKIKTKSRKLSRFSVLKSSQSKNSKTKDISSSIVSRQNLLRNQGHLKKQIIKQVDLKLPEIHRNLSFKEKAIQKIQNYADKSEENSFLGNLSRHFKKQNDKQSKQQIKYRLRCYTQSDTKSKKASTVSLNRNVANNQSEGVKLLSKNPQKSQKGEGNLPKSWSTKIIENFHQVYYKRYYLERERSQKIALLDMSQNLIFNSRQSLDWQIKKKQIVKKLGIKI